MSLEKTIQIYLDSQNAVKNQNGYIFDLQPSISSYYGGIAKMYVKDFRCKHTIANFYGNTDERRFSFQCISPSGDLGTEQHIEFEQNSNYTIGSQFAQILTNKFNNSGDVNQNVKFEWLEFSQKMSFECVGGLTGRTVIFFGNQVINQKYLKFDSTMTNKKSFGISTAPIDLSRDIHNIFISCDQVTPDVITTANDLPSRIVKVPVNSTYGSYISYTQTLPLHKSTLDSHTTNQLKLFLFTDNHKAFFPNKFVMTITVELYKQPVKNDLHQMHLNSKNTPF